MGFQDNEVSVGANGGTEITRRLLEKSLKQFPLEEFQIVSSRIRELDPTKIRVYFAHDLPEDPESKRLNPDDFHAIVFVSNWQYQRFQLVNDIKYSKKCVVIPNCVDVGDTSNVKKYDPTRKVRLVYCSTPHRGLDILVDVFEKISKNPGYNIELDVFSSFQIYGWPEADKRFAPLYERIASHPKMNYHGSVPHDVLRTHLYEKADILAYPCTWLETSCRVLIESMAAGLTCVHPNLGALPETAGGHTRMYDGDSDKSVHADIFEANLELAINDYWKNLNRNSSDVYNYVKNNFSVESVRDKWANLLTTLANKYSTPESRALNRPVFKYITG